MTRSRAYALVAVAAIVPRALVLAVERGDILTRFAEKSDSFAQTFVSSGTYGFIPNEPSAYTQPLYGFFLVPLYWIFGRHWLVVGIAQTAVAAATALLVYEIGRRVVGTRAGLVAAVIATLSPYLVWHDVHVNREIVDQLVAAALVLSTLVAADRRNVRSAAVVGVAAGAAVLGNSRLVFVPLVLALYLLWRRVPWQGAVVLLVVAAVAVAPWVVRNRVQVGCFALTTDSRALWKANNAQTYGVLTHGGWIDDVKSPRGHSFTPEFERDLYVQTGRVRHVDECADLRYFDRRVRTFWREHPGEKAKLMQLAVRMEWDPRPTRTTATEGAGFARSWAQPVYESALYALALVGIAFVPRPFAVLALALLAYQTLAAMAFVGATRYRVPWDFLLALLAAAAVTRVGSLVRESRASASDPWHRRLRTAPADAPAGVGGARGRAGDGGARRPRG